MAYTFHIDNHTETAGTVITELIPPREDSRVRLTKLVYTAGATAHDIVIMKSLQKVRTTAAAVSTATTIVVSSASFVGTSIASGDYLCVEHEDGTFGLYLASGLSTLTVTINALTKGVPSGADVWIFGSPTGDASYHCTLKSVASTRIEFADPTSGICETGYDDGSYSSTGAGDPMMVYSANGTNAGAINQGSAIYTS
jgi:hypothetical protein